MDDRIAGFIDILKKNLEGLPEEEANEAVSYYEEYLNDAQEAGKDISEVLQQLDLPGAISSVIKAETNIARAKQNPGLKNFAKAMSYAFEGIKTPMAFIGVSLFVFISYLLVLTFAIGAFAILIGAAGSVSIAIYEALAIPSGYIFERIGTIGIGLLAAGICLFASYGFFKFCRLLIIFSANVIHRLQKKTALQLPEEATAGTHNKERFRNPVPVLAIITLAGLVLFLVSGLPARYFMIFNSMKPQNITVRTMEYDAGQVNSISVVTAHSHINLKRGNSGKITVSYEQPDWLDYESSVSEGTLAFKEKSNGRLSLFNLISLHESVTEVNITVPENFSPKSINLQSTGGYITTEGFTSGLQVNTYTGNIIFTGAGNGQGKYGLRASTGTGTITVNNKQAGQKSSQNTLYSNNINGNSNIVLLTSRGSIFITEP